MGIEGCILNHNILGHSDSEGREVPHSLDSAGNHFVGYVLCNRDWYRQDSDVHLKLFHLLFERIGMINGNTVDDLSYQPGVDIKGGNDFKAELFQSGIAQQGSSQTTYAEKKGFVTIGKPKKIFQNGDKLVHLIAYARAP